MQPSSWLAGLVLVLGLALPWPVAAAPAQDQPQIPGQAPLPMVEGSFVFRSGSYATYIIHDRKTNQYSRLYFAVLERIQAEDGPAYWLEVAVKPTHQEVVVTRMLAQETPDGPGRLLEVIVQPPGYDPFIVPESFLTPDQPDDQKVGEFKPHRLDAKVEEVDYPYLGRTLRAVKATARDAKGQPVQALVSPQVPPLGVVGLLSAETGMYLEEYGQGAKSLVKGEPVGFYLWLLQVVGREMAK